LVVAAAERDPAQVVALRDDPDVLPAVADEQRADVRLDHPLDRLEHRRICGDLQYLVSLVFEDVRHDVHGLSVPLRRAVYTEIVKPLMPAGSSSWTSTPSTRAPRGPCLHQSTSESTASPAPSSTASSDPSARFRTQ